MIRRGRIYGLVTLMFLLGSLIILIWLAVRVLMSPTLLCLDDFVEYWSAARLNLKGGNPYDPDQMETLQRQIGRVEQVPIMMWNPPWTLALAMPISLFPYPASRLIWFLLSIAAIVWCTDSLWITYGGASHQRWWAWLVALTFGPSLHVLKAGQVSPFLFLGIVGFLHLISYGREWWAGATLALASLKPHLVYLVGLAVLFWAVENRRWRVLLGGAAAIALAVGVTWAINPALLSQYIFALTHYPPEQWATPTLGGVLRLLLGVDKFWLQFVPSVVGGVWFALYWWRHRSGWDWLQRLPLVVLVSVLTAAYGWTFDCTILLVAVLPAAVTLSRNSWQTSPIARAGLLGSYTVVNGWALFSSMDQIWYWWMVPFFLVWYLLVLKIARSDPRAYPSESQTISKHFV